MKIAIGIVSRGNDINYKLAQFLFNLKDDKEYEYKVLLYKSPYSAQKGQEALFKLMEDIDFDYAFITDTDVSCEDGVIKKLVEVGKDVVVGPVWHFDELHSDLHLNVHYEGFEGNGLESRVRYPKSSGIEKIISSSFACLLISKKVFDIFKKANIKYTEDESPHQSDNILFRKFYDLGIDVYVRWDINTIHYRNIELSNDTVNKIMIEGIKDKYNAKL
jgi:hypothetical protein